MKATVSGDKRMGRGTDVEKWENVNSLSVFDTEDRGELRLAVALSAG